MALLQELFEDLTAISKKLKADLQPEDIMEFSNILSRVIPIPNTPDYFRYETFRMVFKLTGLNLVSGLKKNKSIGVKSHILWTSANHIVKWFGIENILYIDWDGVYTVYSKKLIEGVENPKKEYGFEYQIAPKKVFKKHTVKKSTPKKVVCVAFKSKSTDSYSFKDGPSEHDNIDFSINPLPSGTSWADYHD